MSSIVALGAVTVGINLAASQAELRALGLTPGGEVLLSVDHMEEIRLAFEKSRGTLPLPLGGGSVANTADLLARAGERCGMMGVGGDDPFGKIVVSNCERASLKFLSPLEAGATTGYDFYFYSDDGERTIVLTQGANALLSPARIDLAAIQGAELLLLDGFALSFGPESEAAMVHCIEAAEEAGVPFVLTLASIQTVDHYRAFFETYAPKAQMVAGNREQAAVLVGAVPEAPIEMVRAELAKTAIDAVVTLDADGAFARFGAEAFLRPTQPINVVDSTGAGDAFLAAFLIAQRMGLSIPQALAVGNVVSAEVVQVNGARLPLNTDVPRLVQEAVHKTRQLED